LIFVGGLAIQQELYGPREQIRTLPLDPSPSISPETYTDRLGRFSFTKPQGFTLREQFGGSENDIYYYYFNNAEQQIRIEAGSKENSGWYERFEKKETERINGVDWIKIPYSDYCKDGECETPPGFYVDRGNYYVAVLDMEETAPSEILIQILSTLSFTDQDNFSSMVKLSNAWSAGTKTYGNSKLNISFDYPSYFTETAVKSETARFSVRFETPDIKYAASGNLSEDAKIWSEVCENKMTVLVQEFDNKKGTSLYDFIAELYKSYPGNGVTESFESYRKNLNETNSPRTGSYVFEGIVFENPVKTVFFVNNDSIYSFTLRGNCDTGGQYTKEAQNVFDKIIGSIKFL
jgi:hypothetical protein